jgi:hypothetical protein
VGSSSVPPETSAKAPAAAPEDEPAEDEPAALEAARKSIQQLLGG